MENTHTSDNDQDQHAQLSIEELEAKEGNFKQPTAAELAVLTLSQLRYARSQAQELSNEFARLLNRGSSLE